MGTRIINVIWMAKLQYYSMVIQEHAKSGVTQACSSLAIGHDVFVMIGHKDILCGVQDDYDLKLFCNDTVLHKLPRSAVAIYIKAIADVEEFWIRTLALASLASWGERLLKDLRMIPLQHPDSKIWEPHHARA